MKPLNIKNTLSFCLILSPIAVFCLNFQKFALNIPHWDDFAVRNSLAQILETDSFLEKLNLFFAQHNEHRIVLTRILAYLIYVFEGTLNLKILMIFGIGALLGVLYVFYIFLKKHNYPLISLIPISFILFNVGLYENTFWGMASIQNFGVIFLAFLTFYWLIFSVEVRHKNYLYFALISCFLGVFTSSNGILIPAIGCLVLVFQGRKKAFLVWFGSSFVFIAGFFYGFAKNPDGGIKVTFADTKILLKGLLSTFGSVLDVRAILPNKQLYYAMIFGCVLVLLMGVFCIWTLLKKYNKLKQHLPERNEQYEVFLLACIAFIGITSVGIVLARISFGIEILITSKYKIYSVLTLMMGYLILLDFISKNHKNKFIWLSILVSISFNIYIYMADYQDIRLLAQERICDQFKQQVSDKTFPNAGVMAQLQRVEKSFYHSKISKADTLPMPLSVTERLNDFELKLSKDPIEIDLSTAEAGVYFVLKSGKNIYLFPSRIQPAGKKAFFEYNFLIKNKLKIDNFAANISRSYIQSDTYKVGVILVKNNTKTLAWSTESIDIQAITKTKIPQNW